MLNLNYVTDNEKNIIEIDVIFATDIIRKHYDVTHIPLNDFHAI